MSEDPRSLWQHQPTAPVKLSPDELRAKASRFEKLIWRRNAREYVAALAVVIVFAWFAVSAKAVVSQVGNALVVAGAVYVAYRLRQRGAADAPTSEALA